MESPLQFQCSNCIARQKRPNPHKSTSVDLSSPWLVTCRHHSNAGFAIWVTFGEQTDLNKWILKATSVCERHAIPVQGRELALFDFLMGWGRLVVLDCKQSVQQSEPFTDCSSSTQNSEIAFYLHHSVVIRLMECSSRTAPLRSILSFRRRS